MSVRWERRDVDLDQVWRGPDGRVYELVAIADDPTVELRELATGCTRNYVISSLLFGEFVRLDPRPAGEVH